MLTHKGEKIMGKAKVIVKQFKAKPKKKRRFVAVGKKKGTT